LAQVAPAASPTATVGPRHAVAITIGRTLTSDVDVEGEAAGAETLGLAFRFRLFAVEAWLEVGKAEFVDEDRVDRQIGLSIYHHFGRDRLAPYLHLGGGLNVCAPMAGSDLRNDQAYAEVGGGLRYALSGRFELVGDYSVGRRWWVRTRGEEYYPLDRGEAASLVYNPGGRDESFRQIRIGLRLGF
jgi:hypothetical protein